jgi:hypothetical protein
MYAACSCTPWRTVVSSPPTAIGATGGLLIV